MAVRPLKDRILVEQEEKKQQSAGGILLPDAAAERPLEGKVVAVGNGRMTPEGQMLELEVKVGDKVMFGKYAGNEVEIDGGKFLMMKEEDVMGVIE